MQRHERDPIGDAINESCKINRCHDIPMKRAVIYLQRHAPCRHTVSVVVIQPHRQCSFKGMDQVGKYKWFVQKIVRRFCAADDNRLIGKTHPVPNIDGDANRLRRIDTIRGQICQRHPYIGLDGVKQPSCRRHFRQQHTIDIYPHPYRRAVFQNNGNENIVSLIHVSIIAKAPVWKHPEPTLVAALIYQCLRCPLSPYRS